MDEYLTWARTKAHARKVDQAISVLRRVAALQGRVMISSSWGKDSVALCDLACRVLGRCDLVHFASPYELPGNEEAVAHFSGRANVITVEPTRTLADVIAWLREMGGLAYERESDAARGKGKTGKVDRCQQWAVEHGYSTIVMGMRAEESRARRWLFGVRGLVYEAHGFMKADPLGWWTVRDVWAYIASMGLPYNRRIYDAETHGQTRETIRNGGWLTMPEPEKAAWLRRHFRAEYEALAVEFPQIRMVG